MFGVLLVTHINLPENLELGFCWFSKNREYDKEPR